MNENSITIFDTWDSMPNKTQKKICRHNKTGEFKLFDKNESTVNDHYFPVRMMTNSQIRNLKYSNQSLKNLAKYSLYEMDAIYTGQLVI